MSIDEPEFDLDEILESTLDDLDLDDEEKVEEDSQPSSDNVPSAPIGIDNPLRDLLGDADPSLDPFLKKAFSDLSSEDVESLGGVFATLKAQQELAEASDSSPIQNSIVPSNQPSTSSLPNAENSNSIIQPSSQSSLQSSIDEAAEKIAGNSSDPFAGLLGGDVDEDEALKALLAGFQGLNPSDQGSMDSLVESMMKMVMTKDVMYQPIKDITSKYPQWLQENEQKITSDERIEYEKQYELFQKICDAFENDESQEIVCDLMQEMQNHGQPPQELMQELLPGMNLDGGMEQLLQGMQIPTGEAGGGGGIPDMPGGMPNLADLNDPEKIKEYEEQLKGCLTQ